MFDTLSDKLQHALQDVRGRGRLDEESISRAMREIRLALLEADVNLKVVRDFVASVRERALGADVMKSLTPGQQVVKIVHEQLTELMGSGSSQLAFAGRPPTVVLLAGLQGSGKTTTAAKLALLLRKEGKQPALVAADLQRPAAIDQLEQLGAPDPDPGLQRGAQRTRRRRARRASSARASEGRDVVILDTAGRLHVDEELMEELAAVRKEAKPQNVLLVLDAMTGQEAVNVAQAFQERRRLRRRRPHEARRRRARRRRALGEGGHGPAGQARSTGEKLDQIEYFHPDRMASRILGMGDVLTLIEKAEQAIEEDEQEAMEARMRAGVFTFDDFLAAQKMIKKMGPIQGLVKMIPGVGSQLNGVDIDERQLARVEAIVLSMTPQERRLPDIIDGPRRRRIARGSGTTPQDVNQLLRARKEMEKMMKQLKKGQIPAFGPR